MKEKLKKVLNKAKELLAKVKPALVKVKEKLSKIDFLKKLAELAGKYHLILSLFFFCVSILVLIFVPVICWSEFVVPVCILMILEVTMAVLLHRSELWIHAILLVAQIVAGVVIDRVPLTIICAAAYVVTTITLHFAFKKVEGNPAVEKQEVGKPKETVKEEN